MIMPNFKNLLPIRSNSIKSPDCPGKWTDTAMGFGILLYIIFKTLDTASTPHATLPQIAVICGGPFVLLLAGYLYEPARDIRSLGRQIIHDFLTLLLPVLLSASIDTFLDYTLQTAAEEKSTTYIIIEIKRLICTLFFCPRDTILDVVKPNVQWIPGIGIFWILIALFAVRTIYGAISLTVRNITYDAPDVFYYHTETISLAASLLLSVIGWVLIPGHHVYTPFLIDVCLGSLLFFVTGIIYKKIPDSHKDRPVRYLLPIVCAVIAVVCLTAFSFDPVGIAARPQNGILFHIVFPIAVGIFIFEVIRLVRRIPAADEWLSIPGRHLIVYMFIHKLDGMMYILWNNESVLFRLPARLSLIIGVSELILLFFGMFFSIPSVEKDRNVFIKYKALFTYAFYILFAYAMLFEYHNDLSLREFVPLKRHYTTLYTLYRLDLVLCALVAGISFAYINKKYQALAEFFLFWSAFIYTIFGGSHLIFALFMLTIAATGKSARKTLTIALVISASLCILSYVMSLKGYVLWKYSYQGGHGTGVRRNFLGALAPVDAVAHVLYILLMWFALRDGRNRKLPFIEFVPFLLLNLLLYRYTDTRADSIWIFILISVTFIYQLLISFFKGKLPIPDILKKIYALAASISYFILFLVHNRLSYQYSSTTFDYLKKHLSNIIDLSSLEYRIMINHDYVIQYKVWLLGSIPLVPKEQLKTGFIDTSYISILILYGSLITSAILLLYTYIQIRLSVNRKYYTVFLMLIIALNSATEQYLALFQTNVFWILAFSIIDDLSPSSGNETGKSVKSD